MNLLSKDTRDSVMKRARSKNRSFKKQLSIEIFGQSNHIPKAPQTTKHSDLKDKRQLLGIDENGLIFNTMQDGVPEVDLQYLDNRQTTKTSYGAKEQKESRDRSHRVRSSNKSKPLSILHPNSHNRTKSRKQLSQKSRSKLKHNSKDLLISGPQNLSKDKHHHDVDYDLNLNYKEPHYNPKVRAGKRKKREMSKTKENYYHALEYMLSEAQNSNNLTNSQIEYARRYAELKLSNKQKQVSKSKDKILNFKNAYWR